MDLKLNAEVYRIGLNIGLFSISDIVKWADKVIDKLNVPPYEFIELAMSSKETPAEVNLKLMEIEGDVDKDLSIHIVLGLMNQYLTSPKDLLNAIKILDKLIEYLPDVGSYDWIEMELHSFSDALGIHIETNTEIYNRMRKFLANFTPYLKFYF
ncbi:hypothetical protein JFL43_01720 [Viridibacillus sp. YIM B01967]|uniref:Uncharacterized protein n=1 Tax=Viridibacillus soli TaxID=2798301 RepID=A0ABS1H2H2_9BACL|nr:hypothetical protein [Viridibacillus soli]MBK3493607.1 hypothetical protein [Viridibacillus soli]